MGSTGVQRAEETGGIRGPWLGKHCDDIPATDPRFCQCPGHPRDMASERAIRQRGVSGDDSRAIRNCGLRRELSERMRDTLAHACDTRAGTSLANNSTSMASNAARSRSVIGAVGSAVDASKSKPVFVTISATVTSGR